MPDVQMNEEQEYIKKLKSEAHDLRAMNASRFASYTQAASMSFLSLMILCNDMFIKKGENGVGVKSFDWNFLLDIIQTLFHLVVIFYAIPLDSNTVKIEEKLDEVKINAFLDEDEPETWEVRDRIVLAKKLLKQTEGFSNMTADLKPVTVGLALSKSSMLFTPIYAGLVLGAMFASEVPVILNEQRLTP